MLEPRLIINTAGREVVVTIEGTLHSETVVYPADQELAEKVVARVLSFLIGGI